MIENILTQLLILLGATVSVVLLFQKLRIPPSLAYLAVEMALGANTAGPVVSEHYIRIIAEYGIVFLLFTIGLSYSVSLIYALRHTILSLVTAQVVLITIVVGSAAWPVGVLAASG